MLNTDSEKEIQAYISENSDCKLNKIQPVELKGKLKELAVYRLPINLLRYNIRNGRFAAEYRELTEKVGRKLNPDNEEDAKEIMNLLLTQDLNATEILKEDLKRFGQRTPGIITVDGYLINGNRRRAIIQTILEETGKAKWEYIEVSILPKTVNEKDLWRIEAGLQFSRDERLDYGPVNKLLKFREGINAGLTPKKIAAALYGGFKPEEIEKDIERLQLIEMYLEFIGETNHYKHADGVHEHFINLQNFIIKQKKLNADPQEIFNITKFAFSLIKNDIRHMDLRKLNDIMEHKSSREALITEITTNPDISTIINPTKKVNQNENNKSNLPTGENAPARIAFDDVMELAEAARDKKEPKRLLKRGLANLKGIYLPYLNAKDPETRKLLCELEQISGKLMAKIKEE